MMPIMLKYPAILIESDSTNYKKIFDGFNWHVQEIDGHNHNQIKQSIEKCSER